MSEIHEIQVGRPLIPGMNCFQEGPRVVFGRFYSELLIIIDRPTAREIREFKRGTIQLAWLDGGPVSVLCFRFGQELWCDAPFEPYKVPPENIGAPEVPPDSYLFMPAILVDAATGIVKAIRSFTLEPVFAQAVRETTARQ